MYIDDFLETWLVDDVKRGRPVDTEKFNSRNKDGKRLCTICKQWKELLNFNVKCKGYRIYYCRSCQRKKNSRTKLLKKNII